VTYEGSLNVHNKSSKFLVVHLQKGEEPARPLMPRSYSGMIFAQRGTDCVPNSSQFKNASPNNTAPKYCEVSTSTHLPWNGTPKADQGKLQGNRPSTQLRLNVPISSHFTPSINPPRANCDKPNSRGGGATKLVTKQRQ
jgi:hypothetical protein